MIKSLMTSGLCRKTNHSAYFWMQPSHRTATNEVIYSSHTKSLFKAIHQATKRTLCGKYIENHQKNYREGRYTIEIIEPLLVHSAARLVLCCKNKTN